MDFLHNKVKDTKTHIQIQIQFKIKTWSLHYNIGTCCTFCLWTPPLFPCYQRSWWWWSGWWCQLCWSWRGWWWLLTYTQPRCRYICYFSRRRYSPQALRPLGRNFGLLWFHEWLLFILSSIFHITQSSPASYWSRSGRHSSPSPT